MGNEDYQITSRLKSQPYKILSERLRAALSAFIEYFIKLISRDSNRVSNWVTKELTQREEPPYGCIGLDVPHFDRLPIIIQMKSLIHTILLLYPQAVLVHDSSGPKKKSRLVVVFMLWIGN